VFALPPAKNSFEIPLAKKNFGFPLGCTFLNWLFCSTDLKSTVFKIGYSDQPI
jgi:hypothetical protein